MNGFVGTMDRGIQRRIIEVYPIRFVNIRAGLNLCIPGKGEGVWVVCRSSFVVRRLMLLKGDVGCIRRGDAIIGVGFWCTSFRAGQARKEYKIKN